MIEVIKVIKSDFHIHTKHSCDSACMTYDTLTAMARSKGICLFGITDHVHTPYNHGDIEASYEDFCVHKTGDMHFGVEVSCVSQWELDRIAAGDHQGDITYGIRQGGPENCRLAVAVDEGFIERNGIEYVVGGTHWLMYKEYTRKNLIDDYHRQNMFLAQNKHVDIIAHPWWYMGPFKDADGRYTTLPWFDDFDVIPKSMHMEFADALVKNNKYHEINLEAIVLNQQYTDRFRKQYLEYLVFMQEMGVGFTIGSDCHDAGYRIDFAVSGRLLDAYGIRFDDDPDFLK